jgi:phosphoribosylanthranilate isomerase
VLKRTRIKICGITRASDLIDATHLGADAIGLVFAEQSPRRVSIADAKIILTELAPFITVVGLFMNSPSDLIHEAVDQLPISVLQFHGDESGDFCRQFARPYIKAVPMGGCTTQELEVYLRDYPDAQGFLVDSHVPGGAGGQGQVFDWKKLSVTFPRPLILAGGLTPENVRQAVIEVNPYAVDVSSGVEAAKGIKEYGKMRSFIEEVRRAHTN